MSSRSRVLFIAWRSPRSGALYPVAQIVAGAPADGRHFELAYLRGAMDAKADGFVPFSSLDDLDSIYESNELFPFLQNRLMPKSRPDYHDYLERLGLPQTAPQFLVLARSNGRRSTDTVEVFELPSLQAPSGTLTYHFFVRGIRHVAGADSTASRLRANQQLSWCLDETNAWDSNAVFILQSGDRKVGYVPATLLDDFHALRQREMSALKIVVDRINVDPAPVQQRVLCRLEVDGASDFTPLASDKYRAINSSADTTRGSIQLLA